MVELLTSDKIIQHFNFNHALSRFKLIELGNYEAKDYWPLRFAREQAVFEHLSASEKEIHEDNVVEFYSQVYGIVPGQTLEATWADIGKALIAEKHNSIIAPVPKRSRGRQALGPGSLMNKRRRLFKTIESFSFQSGGKTHVPFSEFSDEKIWRMFHFYNDYGEREDRLIDVAHLKRSIGGLNGLPKQIVDWAACGGDETDAYHHNELLKWTLEYADMSMDHEVFKTKIAPKK